MCAELSSLFYAKQIKECLFIYFPINIFRKLNILNSVVIIIIFLFLQLENCNLKSLFVLIVANKKDKSSRFEFFEIRIYICTLDFFKCCYLKLLIDITINNHYCAGWIAPVMRKYSTWISDLRKFNVNIIFNFLFRS